MTKATAETAGEAELPRSILDNLLEGCQVIGPDYRYLYLNDAAARHGRSRREELVGRPMQEAYPGIEDTEMFSVLRRSMEERATARMENAFSFPDGSEGWFELHFEPVPEGVAILSVDITDRKRAELALLRSMRALSTLSRSNQALVRAVDEEAFIQEVARLFVDVGGYPEASVGLLQEVGSDAEVAWVATASSGNAEPLTLGSSEEVSELVRRAVATGEPQSLHWNGAGPGVGEATERGIESCLALPVVAGDARVGVLLIYARDRAAFDVDEHALLEEVALDLGYGIDALRTRIARAETVARLEVAEGRIRSIYDRLPHAVLAWRHEGRVFRLVDVNAAARSLTDDEVSDHLHHPAAVFAPYVPHLESDLAGCLSSHDALRREEECTFPGLAEPRRMELTYLHLPPDVVLLHAEDVTDRRRAEEQLLTGQRLEAVGRLAGGLAHDFNNLLSVILTSTELAMQQVDASDPLREDIEHIHEAGLRAATLIKQLLAFSRRQVLEPTVTDLNSVLSGMEAMLRRVFREDIDIAVHLAPGLGSVVADTAELERVIMNLALNARDAMPKGGKLTIETADVELDEEYAERHIAIRPGPHVLLSVADSGVGMSTETLNRAFEPFFTTKSDGKGTGLGLSSVYGIVKQSGGNVWLYSEPGQGTTVKIYLPRAEGAPSERPAHGPAKAASGSETILLVEDDDGVRRAAERILTGAGYRVLVAPGGAEAIRICEEEAGKIDLVLTDIVMPGMRGDEIARRLRETFPALKVLFMSGYTDKAIGHQWGIAEGSPFLSKPFSVESLRQKVRDVLDS